MTPDYEKQLAERIDRELKALGELPAPPAVARRVLAAIEQRATVPWYRRAWPTWPCPLRAVSLLVLLGGFGWLCLASWQAMQTPAVTTASLRVGRWVEAVRVLGKAGGLVIDAVAAAIHSLGPAILCGGLVALLLGYACCLGLGTIYVRLAFARR